MLVKSMMMGRGDVWADLVGIGKWGMGLSLNSDECDGLIGIDATLLYVLDAPQRLFQMTTVIALEPLSTNRQTTDETLCRQDCAKRFGANAWRKHSRRIFCLLDRGPLFCARAKKPPSRKGKTARGLKRINNQKKKKAPMQRW